MTLKPRIDGLEKTVGEHDVAIKRHEIALFGIDEGVDGIVQQVADLVHFAAELRVYVRIMTLVGTALTLTLIAFVWAIITHAVELVH